MPNLRELWQGADNPHVDAVSYDEFLESFRWHQGEHVAMIGPTGSGKTTLALSLLEERKYVVVFATKPRDSTLQQLITRKKWIKVSKWQDKFFARHPEKHPKRVLWPNARSLYAASRQRKVFRDAFERIYDEGSWCVYLDELWMMVNFLKLQFEVRVYLQQSRALGISLVCATQRPKFVPLEVYDQSTHLFFWRDNDYSNLKRISDISWLNSDHVRTTVANLEVFEVLYIQVRNNNIRMMKFTPPPPEGN